MNWSIKDISRNLKQYTNGDYVLLFPFCSKKHVKKKWPYFSELIIRIKAIYKNKYPVLVAPGPNEVDEAKKLNAKIVLEKNQPIDISFLIVHMFNSCRKITYRLGVCFFIPCSAICTRVGFIATA